jgi:hypothetical protein
MKSPLQFLVRHAHAVVCNAQESIFLLAIVDNSNPETFAFGSVSLIQFLLVVEVRLRRVVDKLCNCMPWRVREPSIRANDIETYLNSDWHWNIPFVGCEGLSALSDREKSIGIAHNFVNLPFLQETAARWREPDFVLAVNPFPFGHPIIVSNSDPATRCDV